jgi:uncharacterized protein YggE
MLIRSICLTTALLFTAAAMSPGVAQQVTQNPRTLSLTGQGKVTSAPDIAIISSGVVSEAKTARAALDANNAAMADVLKTIAASGVAKKDIQTSNFSVQPKYTYRKSSNGTQEAPRITGYTVSNTVTTIVRDLATLGSVLDSVVSSGANRLSGLSFSIAEPEPLRNEARKQAVAEAIARANLYAQAAGVTLGNILSITEAGGSRPPQPVYAQARSLAAEASVPAAQGEQTINMQVNIVWEIN